MDAQRDGILIICSSWRERTALRFTEEQAPKEMSMRFVTIPAIPCWLGLVVLLGGATPSRAEVVLSLNTGFDNATSSVLAPFTVDAKYQVTGPGSVTFFPQARDASGLPLTYVAAPAGSRWDYFVNSPTSTGNDFVPGGNYDFTTTVDLTGFDPTTAQIKGLQVATDNALLAVIIDGTTVLSRNPTGSVIEEFHSLTDVGDLGLGDFHSGLNTIEFVLLNQEFIGGGPSPAAFLAVGDIEASPTPEPSRLLQLSMGALGLFGRRCFQRWQRVSTTSE